MESNLSCSLKDNKFQCSNDTKLKTCSDFSVKELSLIQRRSGCVDQLQAICLNHERQFLTFYEQKQTKCCDPLDRHTKPVKTNLWTINENYDHLHNSKNPVILEGRKLCPNCRNFFQKNDVPLEQQEYVESDLDHTVSLVHPHVSDLSSGGCSSQGSVGFCTPPDMLLDRINKSLSLLGIETVTKRSLIAQSFRIKKLDEIRQLYESSFDKILEIETPKNMTDALDKIDFEITGKEILSQLKNKFHSCESNKDKIRVLSLLPMSWTSYKIAKEFNTSLYLADKTKQLVAEQGILCTPQPKPKYVLPEETVQQAINFYLDPEVSREMPGKKDFVSVNVNGKREHKQKRLVLGNLEEIYQFFQKEFPEKKISFSKFASLRPKQCVLAGASGTHAVCVCCIHENFNLMITGASLSIKFKNESLISFSDFLKSIKCTVPTEACHLRTCTDCLDTTELKDAILDNLESDEIECITYQQWVNVDRYSLETLVKPCDQFVEILMEKLEQLSTHHFITKQQSEYFRRAKNNATEKEVVAVADFSENYSFILQNSIQGVHWNNAQATVHPFCCYRGGDFPELLNYVIISDDLEHNTSAVNYFQKMLIEFLKTKIPDLQKVTYFSDGAASQYKNKYNVLNLCLHKEDFGISADWHFYATSHGKGPSDGLGGTIKRLASRASLQLPPEKQIQTPLQFFEWSRQNIEGINIDFAQKKDIANHRIKMNTRFKNVVPVKGIRGFHSCVPVENGYVEMKTHSLQDTGVLFNIAENYNWAKLQPKVEPISTRSSTKKKKQAEHTTKKQKRSDDD